MVADVKSNSFKAIVASLGSGAARSDVPKTHHGEPVVSVLVEISQHRETATKILKDSIRDSRVGFISVDDSYKDPHRIKVNGFGPREMKEGIASHIDQIVQSSQPQMRTNGIIAVVARPGNPIATPTAPKPAPATPRVVRDGFDDRPATKRHLVPGLFGGQ